MGQLVIESEVADIHVKILKDGKEAKGLTLRPGANTSRMMVDRYEIVLETPSDDVSIENGVFTLRRGETVVARVRVKANSEGNPAIAKPASNPDEPRYNDKTSSEWLETLRREKSPEMVMKATDAVAVLKQYVDVKEVEDAIREFALSRFPEDEEVINALIAGSQPLERLKEEFQRANEEIRIGLLTYGRITKDDTKRDESITRKQFLQWIVENSNAFQKNDEQQLRLSKQTVEKLVFQIWHHVIYESGSMDLLDRMPPRDWIVGYCRVYFVDGGLLRKSNEEIDRRAPRKIAEGLSEESLDWRLEGYFLWAIETSGVGSDPDTRRQIAMGLGSRLKQHSKDISTSTTMPKEIGSRILRGYGPLPHSWTEQMTPTQLFPSLCALRLLWLFEPDERPTEAIQAIYDASLENHIEVLKILSENRSTDTKKFDITISSNFLHSDLISNTYLCHHLCHVIAGAMLGKDVEYLPGKQWKPFELEVTDPDLDLLKLFEAKDVLKKRFLTTSQAAGFIDQNGDDFVSFNEIPASRREITALDQKGSRPEDHGLPPDTDQRWVIYCIKRVKEFDRDGNGVLEQSEWLKHNGPFETIDADSNGEISVAEYYTYIRNRRKTP